MKFKNKSALVVGASKGVGRAVVQKLLSEGAQVTGVARDQSKLQELNCEFVAADLMDPSQLQSFLKSLENRHFDICVQNLGGTLGIKEPLFSQKDFTRVLQLNFGIAAEINRLLLPKMQAKKWGRIVHTSSNSAIKPFGSLAYGVAKATLNSYVEKLGPVYAKDNVILSAIMPGPIGGEGSIWAERLKSNPIETQKFIDENLPLKRFQEPEEVAGIMLALCNERPPLMSGHLLLCDG